jgi:hypothetical protein
VLRQCHIVLSITLLHLVLDFVPAGLERLLDEAARLRASTAADDASSVADRKARSLAMQAKLRDIAEAQVRDLDMLHLMCLTADDGARGEGHLPLDGLGPLYGAASLHAFRAVLIQGYMDTIASAI